MRNEAVVVAANVEDNLAAASTQLIGRAECALDVGGRVPIRVFHRREPQHEGTAAGMTGGISFRGLALDEVNFHIGYNKNRPAVRKMRTAGLRFLAYRRITSPYTRSSS